jgi:hypothetical protein
MCGNHEMSSILHEEDSTLPIQLQALEIIDEILSSTVESEAGAREALRRQVENYPGQPQLALLMHMLTIHPSDQRDRWNSRYQHS